MNTARMAEGRRLFRQSGLTCLAAGAAVASGLALDAAIASRFGAGAATDAFFVAARIPLGLLAIMMVGANQVLVPKFSTWMAQKPVREQNRLMSLVLVGTALLASAFAAAIAVVAGPLMRISAPGLSAEHAALAASVARVMFLLIPLVSLAEVLRALLNARASFTVPAGMNVVMNGLAAALVLVLAGADVHLVAWAYVAGAAAQLVLVSVMARRRGFRFVPSTALADPEIRATGRLAGRPLLGAGLNPVARLCEQFVVSFLPSGSITILNYGYRLISAIGGSVFFRSVMVTLLPRLTRATAGADADETERMTALGVRMMLVVSVPLTAFMAVLSKPFVRALFQRGNFSPADASLLGAVLAVYAASLVGSALQRAMLAPFYARLDTRVPLRNTFYGVAANIVLLACTVVPFRHHPRTAVLGVALAYSLAQYVNLAHAWIILRRTMPRPFAGTGRLTFHLTFASAASAVAMFALGHRFGLDGRVPPVSLFWRAGAVGGVGVAVLAGILATAVTVRPAPMLRPLWRDR